MASGRHDLGFGRSHGDVARQVGDIGMQQEFLMADMLEVQCAVQGEAVAFDRRDRAEFVVGAKIAVDRRCGVGRAGHQDAVADLPARHILIENQCARACLRVLNGHERRLLLARDHGGSVSDHAQGQLGGIPSADGAVGVLCEPSQDAGAIVDRVAVVVVDHGAIGEVFDRHGVPAGRAAGLPGLDVEGHDGDVDGAGVVVTGVDRQEGGRRRDQRVHPHAGRRVAGCRKVESAIDADGEQFCLALAGVGDGDILGDAHDGAGTRHRARGPDRWIEPVPRELGQMRFRAFRHQIHQRGVFRCLAAVIAVGIGRGCVHDPV